MLISISYIFFSLIFYIQGLAGLKSLGIVHADLKPDNIMFNEGFGNNLLVKIIDFGWAFHIKNSHKVFCKKIQAIPYRAPEVCFQKNLDYGLDLWALGCIMPEIVTGVKLFDTADEELLVNQMIHMLSVPEFLLPTLQNRQIKKCETEFSIGWLRFNVCYFIFIIYCNLNFFFLKFHYLLFDEVQRNYYFNYFNLKLVTTNN